MIRKHQQDEAYPWDLLLDADPDKQKVKDYLQDSQVLYYLKDQMKIGVLVFQEREQEWEVMNVAVAEVFQGQGIGRQLLMTAFSEMQNQSTAKPVLIKTGDLTSSALSLYRGVGFEPIEIVKDYFVTHYTEPIYENGKRLRNQVILEKKLKKIM